MKNEEDDGNGQASSIEVGPSDDPWLTLERQFIGSDAPEQETGSYPEDGLTGAAT